MSQTTVAPPGASACKVGGGTPHTPTGQRVVHAQTPLVTLGTSTSGSTHGGPSHRKNTLLRGRGAIADGNETGTGRGVTRGGRTYSNFAETGWSWTDTYTTWSRSRRSSSSPTSFVVTPTPGKRTLGPLLDLDKGFLLDPAPVTPSSALFSNPRPKVEVQAVTFRVHRSPPPVVQTEAEDVPLHPHRGRNLSLTPNPFPRFECPPKYYLRDSRRHVN